MESELAFYDPAVHRFNHYATRTPPLHTVQHGFGVVVPVRVPSMARSFKKDYKL